MADTHIHIHLGGGEGQVVHSEASKAPSKASKPSPPTKAAPKPKRAASAYSKRYAAAFKKVAPKYKLKSGAWKKGGYKAAVKAAHKLARK